MKCSLVYHIGADPAAPSSSVALLAGVLRAGPDLGVYAAPLLQLPGTTCAPRPAWWKLTREKSRPSSLLSPWAQSPSPHAPFRLPGKVISFPFGLGLDCTLNWFHLGKWRGAGRISRGCCWISSPRVPPRLRSRLAPSSSPSSPRALGLKLGSRSYPGPSSLLPP